MSSDQPPPPPVEGPNEPGPSTGEPAKDAPIVDARGRFGELTGRTSVDPAEQQAFIEGKIDMIRGDPNLTEAQKEEAIEELRKR